MRIRSSFLLASAPGVALLWIVISLVLSPLILEHLELRLFDLAQRLRGVDETRSDDIILVNVDENTIASVGWPVPRAIWTEWLASMVILELNPRQIGFDLFMTHHLCFPEEDTTLAQVMALEPVVLGVGLPIPEDQEGGRADNIEPLDSLLVPWFSRKPELGGSSKIIHSEYVSERPLPVLLEAASGIGNVAVDPDRDGVIRRIPIVTEYAGHMVSSFGLAMYLHHMGVTLSSCTLIPGEALEIEGRSPIPLDASSRMILHFSGGPETYRTVSFSDLLGKMRRAMDEGSENGIGELGFIDGATLIVGITDPSLMDLPATPVDPRFPGPEIQATALDNLLRAKHIHRVDRRWELFIMAFFALGAALAGLKLRPATGVVLTLFGAFLFVVIVFRLGESSGLWFGAVTPLFALAGSYGTGITVERLAKEREQRLVKDAFGKYVSPVVLRDLLEDPSSVLSGKGFKKVITVLFSDVKGFSRLCEENDASSLLDQLNEYLTVMTEIVFKHGGTVDKFMGDGLMAFFGHPVEMPDHALRAVLAAEEMQIRLLDLRKEWEEENRLLFRIRVGVNSGEVIAGNMGGGGKMDYTVFGKSVNLAQRLESNSDVDGVLVSKTTLDKSELDPRTVTAKTIEAKNIGTITAYQIPLSRR